MKFEEFKNQIESIYKRKFDKSWVSCRIYRCLGKSITIDMTLANDIKECISQIAGNDMIRCSFMINLPDKWNDTEDLPENLTMRTLTNEIKTKPVEDYFYCGYEKITFRQTKGSPEKLISTFEKFVERLDNAIKEEYKADNLMDFDRKLYEGKYVK